MVRWNAHKTGELLIPCWRNRIIAYTILKEQSFITARQETNIKNYTSYKVSCPELKVMCIHASTRSFRTSSSLIPPILKAVASQTVNFWYQNHIPLEGDLQNARIAASRQRIANCKTSGSNSPIRIPHEIDFFTLTVPTESPFLNKNISSSAAKSLSSCLAGAD